MKHESASSLIFQYRVHGLVIHSELDLQIGDCAQTAKQPVEKPDVWVVSHAPSIDWAISPGINNFAYFKYTSQGDFFCEIPEMAKLWVSSGNLIRVDLLPGALLADVAAYILGTGLGAILHQRGILVLHGNAISTAKGTLLCLGDSGAGKSTLSAALVQLSGQLLADDVVTFSDKGNVHAGLPRIKLWQNSLNLLTLASDGLKKVLNKENKFIWPQETVFTSGKRIDLVVILHNKPQSELQILELKGPVKLLAMLRHVYRPEFMEKISSSANMLQKLIYIFNETRVIDVSRELGNTNPIEFAKLLLDEMAK